MSSSADRGLIKPGTKFGWLKANVRDTEKEEATSYPVAYWSCTCKCGNTVAVRQDNLLSKKTRSCGCLKKQGIW